MSEKEFCLNDGKAVILAHKESRAVAYGFLCLTLHTDEDAEFDWNSKRHKSTRGWSGKDFQVNRKNYFLL